MENKEILRNKKILAVDDEPDVLEIVQEALAPCEISTADSYESAKQLISTGSFDLVLLDIMGVNGFALLELCRERQIPAAMLTANAINVDSVNKALNLGAISFLPKDELANIADHLAEMLEGLAQGKSHWRRLFDRLGPFFSDRLGLTWENIGKPRNPPYMY
ncbi:MAG: response regulator [Desulfomonile tiedjei]|uniref:Response regulator n=1 Tax=Desulfomonile tiedjei TaxID=2358 RepID=A0A9D6Z4Y5_9BACT|nr:response regulator [Desulfomonile tiedjei]